jgi:hypothetical protein
LRKPNGTATTTARPDSAEMAEPVGSSLTGVKPEADRLDDTDWRTDDKSSTTKDPRGGTS